MPPHAGCRLPHDGQAQPGAGCVLAGRAAIEAIEHQGAFRQWDAGPIVLHLHQLTHFLYLVGGDTPTAGRSGDHFGIEVYERDALETIVARARAFKAERDPAVTITEPTTEDYGTIRIYNTYIGYLLPFEVEVQFYEGVEA